MISCDLHDTIEIACMYHFSVELTLKNGECVSGIADTIVIKKEVTNKDRQECIRLVDNTQADEKKSPLLIPLSTLAFMRALTPNSHFNTISFDESTFNE